MSDRDCTEETYSGQRSCALPSPVTRFAVLSWSEPYCAFTLPATPSAVAGSGTFPFRIGALASPVRWSTYSSTWRNNTCCAGGLPAILSNSPFTSEKSTKNISGIMHDNQRTMLAWISRKE